MDKYAALIRSQQRVFDTETSGLFGRVVQNFDESLIGNAKRRKK